MKKLLSLICVLLVAALILPSCQKKADDKDYDHAADFTSEDGEIYNSVPRERYSGYEFCVLNARVGSSAFLMDTDTVIGDSLNEALLKRNYNVEERVGITISEVIDTPEKVFDISVKACLSGEDTYDAVCNTSDNMATMAVCGYLVTDVYLPGMDLTKPWWNETAVESVAVNDARYLFYGDIQLSYYDAHSMMGVNMDTVHDTSGMPDPYDLVDRGEWTVDAMLRMMTMAANDVDGNGKLDMDDSYGISFDRAALLPMIFGSGARITSVDKEDIPVLSCFTDTKLYDVFRKVSDTAFSNGQYVYDTEKNTADGMSPTAMFKSGRTLFLATTVGTLSSLRNMEYEFGVLPMPKQNSAQSEYVSLIVAQSSTAIGVMPTGRDLRRTANILENLAAESHRQKGIRSCYVDSVLSFIYVDDEESRKNLNLIFETGVFEPCQIYGWGGICETLEKIAGKSDYYSSSLATLRSKAAADVGNTVVELQRFKQ